MELDIANFGKRLEECIEKAGYTNKDLTSELKISKNAIGNYKNNQIPNATILFELSQKIGTSMEYLLTGKITLANNFTENEKDMLNIFSKIPEREQLKFIGRLEQIAEEYNNLKKGELSSFKTG